MEGGHRSNQDGLRSFIEAAREIGECIEIKDADWDLEIGTVTEAAAEKIDEPPMLLFDRIKDYPEGFRVVCLPLASRKRVALILDLPLDKSKLELTRLAARKISGAKPLPPREVADGPVMEERDCRQGYGPVQVPGAALPYRGRRPLHRLGRFADQPRSRLRLRQRRHLPYAGAFPSTCSACG